jgi:hypothetical protein
VRLLVVVILAAMASGCAAVRRDCFVGQYTGDRICASNGRLSFEMNKNFPKHMDRKPQY